MKEESKKKILKVSGLIGLFLIVFGLSYALFTVTLNGTKKVKIKTGKLELQLLDSNNNPIYIIDQNSTSSYEINLDNQVPVSDEVGLDSTAFEFKLKNTGNIKASYTIYLDDVALESGESRIDDEYIRYSLTKNGSEENPQELSSRELDKGTIEADNTTNEYALKIWIAETATNEGMDKVFNATLRVEGTQYVKTGPFDDGTFAASLYNLNEKLVLETGKVPNGFDSEQEQSGLYKYIDEYNTTTYIYRGMPDNNYVTFAEQIWRILRLQEDGTIKIISDYPLNYVNTTYDSGESSWDDITFRNVAYTKNANSVDDLNYIGSNIEGYLKSWYTDIMSDYDSKIAINNYCNDHYNDSTSGDTTKYFANKDPLYGVYNRVVKNDNNKYEWSPSFSCSSDDIVEAKVALATADELILGGFGHHGDYLKKCYLHRYDFSNTMSILGCDSHECSVYSTEDGYTFIDVSADFSGGRSGLGVYPVITLKADVLPSSGDGTEEHPYVID